MRRLYKEKNRIKMHDDEIFKLKTKLLEHCGETDNLKNKKNAANRVYFNSENSPFMRVSGMKFPTHIFLNNGF